MDNRYKVAKHSVTINISNEELNTVLDALSYLKNQIKDNNELREIQNAQDTFKMERKLRIFEDTKTADIKAVAEKWRVTEGTVNRIIHFYRGYKSNKK